MVARADAPAEHSPTNTPAPGQYSLLPLALIEPNPDNPRKAFDPVALQELADSIAQDGILQPLVVLDHPGGRFRLIAGERRWRAAQVAGLERVPVIVHRHLDALAVARMMLVENAQREDLDPVEEAEAFRALQDRLGMRQADIAAAVHRSQPTIANAMRVLALPPAALELVRQRKLTRGHGVALLRYKGFPEFQAALAAHAVARELKVKDLEGTDVLMHSDLKASTKTYREIDRYGDRPAYKTICPQCPFGAFLPDAWGGGYCLRPEHCAELGAAARKEQKATLAAALEAAKLDPQQAPSLESLGQGAVALRTPGSSPAVYAEPIPPGCTDACPCRVTCTHRGALVTACRDFARLRRLEQVGRERERTAQDEAALRRRDAVRRRFTEGTPPTPARLASLLATAAASPARFRPLLGVPKDVELSDDEIRTALAKLPAERVLACAARLVLEYEAQDTWRWQHGKASALTWFFGGDPLHQARSLVEIRAADGEEVTS